MRYPYLRIFVIPAAVLAYVVSALLQKIVLEAGQAGSTSGYFCLHGILHRLFCAIEII
jgi:hypothetical protein